MHLAWSAWAKRNKTARDESLDGIHEKDGNAGGFSENPKDVRWAGIATANGAKVDSFGFRHEVTSGDGPKQIPHEAGQREAEKFHAGESRPSARSGKLQVARD